MPKRSSKKRFILIFIGIVGFVLVVLALFLYFSRSNKPFTTVKKEQAVQTTATDEPAAPTEAYTGTITAVGTAFSVKVPAGWSASVSTRPTFLALIFARPNQLSSLVYDSAAPAAVDHDGIPAWSGLTEHFYVAMPLAGKEFRPSDHREITSEPFTFDDGTVGVKYTVIKHADEAAAWGGLQKDDHWEGRVYVYEKAGKQVEAHLALYPSSNADIAFYNQVAKSIHYE